MTELSIYESNQLTAITKWENQEPSVLGRGLNTLLKPLSWTIEKIIPAKVLEGALSACNSSGALLADKGDILRDAEVSDISQLRTKELKLSDSLANEVHNWALGIASAEGAGVGYMGAVGLLIDIPALITLAYRSIHKIGYCYGYVCDSPEERMFINTIFQAAQANTVKEKAIALVSLKQIQVVIAKQAWRKIALKAAENRFSKEAFIMFIKSTSKSLGKNLTKRKALQAIPFVGAGIGAAMNASFIQDVCWAARRAFQKRWLADNKKILIEED